MKRWEEPGWLIEQVPSYRAKENNFGTSLEIFARKDGFSGSFPIVFVRCFLKKADFNFFSFSCFFSFPCFPRILSINENFIL